MMPVWIVMIRDANRWIDSVWVQEEAAYSRAHALRTAMKAFGVIDPRCWVVPTQLEDGVLGTKRNRKSKNLES